MMKNYREKNVTSQMVSPPLIVSLTPQEADLVTRYMDVFQSFGYEISPFGGKDYAINAVPHNLYGIATEELFIEILDNLEEVRRKAAGDFKRPSGDDVVQGRRKGQQSSFLCRGGAAHCRAFDARRSVSLPARPADDHFPLETGTGKEI